MVCGISADGDFIVVCGRNFFVLAVPLLVSLLFSNSDSYIGGPKQLEQNGGHGSVPKCTSWKVTSGRVAQSLLGCESRTSQCLIRGLGIHFLRFLSSDPWVFGRSLYKA